MVLQLRRDRRAGARDQGQAPARADRPRRAARDLRRPGGAARIPEIDFCLRDEGDWTFPRLVRAIGNGANPSELALIPGLTWRRGTEIVKNPSGAVVEDLDGLPFPRTT